ncbi:MAG: 50S ribosomal protein L9 [Bacteroidetes bacterium GWA2_31_9b]|nr:MAG: 50S ribosomal protein L9 [Bacteroidetes bacterium GWA2_31_9b]
MEVILKQDMPNLGNANEIVRVKNGYGRNYLVPKGFAVVATPSAKKMHTENLKQRAHKEEKIKNEALENAKKLEKVSLTIGAKTSSTGKIFGSVNTIQIAEALKEKGFDIDRKNITIAEDQIKEVGSHKVTVKLHREVKVEVAIEIVAE